MKVSPGELTMRTKPWRTNPPPLDMVSYLQGHVDGYRTGYRVAMIQKLSLASRGLMAIRDRERNRRKVEKWLKAICESKANS